MILKLIGLAVLVFGGLIVMYIIEKKKKKEGLMIPKSREWKTLRNNDGIELGKVNVCPTCGSTISDGAELCKRCGQLLQD